MCGIIGATGAPSVVPILLEGLHRLEYRGYDSAGIALVANGTIWRRRRAGGNRSIGDLADGVGDAPTVSTGIGHSRWATHGAPTEPNCHPHIDARGKLALIHNGIIENYRQLASTLPGGGTELTGDTDTEVLAHVIGQELAERGGGLTDAVRSVLRRVRGKFAIAVVHADDPAVIVAARRGSPLVIGLDDTTGYVASDIPAIHGRATRFFVIDNDRVCEVGPGTVTLTDLHGEPVEPVEREVTWDLEAAEKGGYPDFMLKEIHEQPAAVRDTLLGRSEEGRLSLDQVRLSDDDLRMIDKVFVVACGSSFHAGMVGRLAIEHFAQLPVEIEIASEFRYRDPVLDSSSLVVAISQSGETLDTMEAVAHAKATSKARVLAVTNVVDSSLARDADAVLYTRAGPEIGVAATKTHLAQMVAMQVLALYLAQVRGKWYPSEIADALAHLQGLPEKVEAAISGDHAGNIVELAGLVRDVRDFFFIGRGVGWSVAMEGALKLKEISYLRAEGYPAGELKHGPIALLEPGTVVVAVATPSRLQEKVLANVQEVKARGATVIALAAKADADDVAAHADHLLVVPDAGHELFQPIVDAVPLQLFAYHLAKARGNDVDKPRNLAKTVTVE